MKICMRTKNKSFNIIILADVILILLMCFGKRLVHLAMNILPTCPFLKMGLLCPACGGTRCTFAILNLDFAAAFNFNPFIFVLFFYAATAYICVNLHFLFGFNTPRKIYKALLDYKVIIILAVAFMIFGVVRNFI